MSAAHNGHGATAIALHAWVNFARPCCCWHCWLGGRAGAACLHPKVDNVRSETKAAKQRCSFRCADPLVSGLQAVPQLLGTRSIKPCFPRRLDPGRQGRDVWHIAAAPK